MNSDNQVVLDPWKQSNERTEQGITKYKITLFKVLLHYLYDYYTGQPALAGKNWMISMEQSFTATCPC